jgi:hypothetical protein
MAVFESSLTNEKKLAQIVSVWISLEQLLIEKVTNNQSVILKLLKEFEALEEEIVCLRDFVDQNTPYNPEHVLEIKVKQFMKPVLSVPLMIDEATDIGLDVFEAAINANFSNDTSSQTDTIEKIETVYTVPQTSEHTLREIVYIEKLVDCMDKCSGKNEQIPSYVHAESQIDTPDPHILKYEQLLDEHFILLKSTQETSNSEQMRFQTMCQSLKDENEESKKIISALEDELKTIRLTLETFQERVAVEELARNAQMRSQIEESIEARKTLIRNSKNI